MILETAVFLADQARPVVRRAGDAERAASHGVFDALRRASW